MNPNQDPNAVPDAATPQPGADAPITPVTDPFAPAQPVTPEVSSTPAVDVEPVAPPVAADTTPEAAAPVYPTAPVEPAVAAAPVSAPNPVATPTPVVPVEPVAPSPFASADPAAPAPVAFGTGIVTPGAPIASAPGAGAPGPKQKGTKKIVLLASIIGGIILLAAAAVVVFLMLTSVSKQDYADAAKQFNSVASTYNDLNSINAPFTSSSTEELDKKLTEIKDGLTKFKAENEELGKLKAVKVGEGKKLYDEFDAKVDAYVAYNEGLVTSVKEVNTVIQGKCAGNGATDTDPLASMRACVAALGTLPDVPNEAYKQYIAVLKTETEAMISVNEEAQGLTDPFGSQYQLYRSLTTRLNESTKKLREAQTNAQKTLKEQLEAVSPQETSKALRTFLNDSQKK